MNEKVKDIIDQIRALASAASFFDEFANRIQAAHTFETDELRKGIERRSYDMVVPLALWDDVNCAGLEWKDRAKAAEKDAARYRWLMANCGEWARNDHIQDMWANCKTTFPTSSEWNEAIDLAIADEKKEKRDE